MEGMKDKMRKTNTKKMDVSEGEGRREGEKEGKVTMGKGEDRYKELKEGRDGKD